MRNEKNDKGLVSGELPKPGYDNSFIFSLVAQIPDPPSPGMDYLINQLGSGIQSFKNRVDALVKNVETYNVGLHLVLVYGMSRKAKLYKAAKTEDIRNAQWFNDNNLASKAKIESSGIDDFVTTSFSRYARKLRKHLETTVSAAFKYLKTLQQNHPGLLLVVSAPGEAELNSMRTNTKPVLQDYFCDYSPFAVLEFRDWLKHEGMYGRGAKYEGDGYNKGGTRYRGGNGLKNFNTGFGTSSMVSAKYWFITL
ncbi:MAG: hypothetical protein GY940_02400 [bacterium]|nr:hypothetical protein [bacterium]